MFGVIVAFLLVVFSFNFFMISYQINGINRLVFNAPLSLYETAINLYDLDEDHSPYFMKETLEDNITYYFSYHMPRYTEHYSLSFYYYQLGNHSLDMSDEAKAVEVNVTADLALSYQYRRTMHYEIRSD